MLIALQFCELALSAASHLSAAERADLYDYAALTMERDAVRLHESPNDAALLKSVAKSAQTAASALRECEQAQLTFKKLLTTTATH